MQKNNVNDNNDNNANDTIRSPVLLTTCVVQCIISISFSCLRTTQIQSTSIKPEFSIIIDVRRRSLVKGIQHRENQKRQQRTTQKDSNTTGSLRGLKSKAVRQENRTHITLH